jgi:hypothetical protein
MGPRNTPFLLILHKETEVKKLVSLLTLWVAFAAPMALAQDDQHLDPRVRAKAEAMWKKMANNDGMVTQKVVMDMVMQKFNEMDKGKKGMISAADAARIMLFLSGQVGAL